MKLQLRKQAQKGFTMIELVIVIAILGILAAFALPRFADLTTNANTAAATSIAGTLNASLGIVKAKYIANGSTGSTVRLDNGTDILVTSNGDLNMTAMDTPKCTALFTALLSSSNGLTVGPVTATTCTIGTTGYRVTLASTGATGALLP